MRYRTWFFFVLIALITSPATADPRNLDVFTSFEPPDTGPEFGTGSMTAQFTGGSALTLGDEALYHSGDFSWQTPAGVTTVVQFSTPASLVELFALDTETPDATIVAFDLENQIVGQANLTGSFSSPMFDFSNPLQFAGIISRLEIQNPGGGPVWTDDFGFSVIPEPSCSALLVVATLVAGAARLKRPAWRCSASRALIRPAREETPDRSATSGTCFSRRPWLEITGIAHSIS